MASWIDVSDRLPAECEQVIVFNAPRREMAQYVGHIKPATPWNMMDGRYLDADAIVMWAELPPHPPSYYQDLPSLPKASRAAFAEGDWA